MKAPFLISRIKKFLYGKPSAKARSKIDSLVESPGTTVAIIFGMALLTGSVFVLATKQVYDSDCKKYRGSEYSAEDTRDDEGGMYVCVSDKTGERKSHIDQDDIDRKNNPSVKE